MINQEESGRPQPCAATQHQQRPGLPAADRTDRQASAREALSTLPRYSAPDELAAAPGVVYRVTGRWRERISRQFADRKPKAIGIPCRQDRSPTR